MSFCQWLHSLVTGRDYPLDYLDLTPEYRAYIQEQRRKYGTNLEPGEEEIERQAWPGLPPDMLLTPEAAEHAMALQAQGWDMSDPAVQDMAADMFMDADFEAFKQTWNRT